MDTVRAIAAILLLIACLGPAQAQEDGIGAHLSAEKAGDVETGSYSAGDNLNFTLDSYGDKYLLRFADSPESYVLTVEHIFLGGRILRYDTGATALRVSVWGGMTLYTTSAPNGVPATRVGDDVPIPRDPVTPASLIAALSDEERHFLYTQNLHLRFSADAALLAAKNDDLAFDALISTAAGIERLLASPGGRDALFRKFNAVRLIAAAKPGVTLSGKTLVVGFSPAAGAAGRASSRQVAVELGKMLQIAEAG